MPNLVEPVLNNTNYYIFATMADTPNATTLVLDVGAHAKLKREKAVALLLSSIKSGTISVRLMFVCFVFFCFFDLSQLEIYIYII